MQNIEHLSLNCEQNDSASKGNLKQRGRPKKYDRKNDRPFYEQYFKSNSAALLSANLYYVGNVLKVLQKSVSNRGFLINPYIEEEDFYTDINNFQKIPEGLEKLISNIIQCGPKYVVDELIQLFAEIANMKGDNRDIVNQLLGHRYDGSTLRAIEFTNPKYLQQMVPPIVVTPLQKQSIRAKFQEFLTIIVDIIKSQLKDGADSQYCSKITEIIKEKESSALAHKSKFSKLSKLSSFEPLCRKIRKAND